MEEKTFLDYMIDDKDDNKFLDFFVIVFWYRTLRKIPDIFREIKWLFQKIFRLSHSSDRDIWGLYDHLAPIILKKLLMFRKNKLYGFPCYFSDYSEDDGAWTKESYNKAMSNGDVVGGEFEAWLLTLDKMIFAFDFITYYEYSDKKRDEMLARHKLEYPHQKIPENKKISYTYRFKDKKDEEHIMISHLPPEDTNNKNKKFIGESIDYYNFELEGEYYEMVQEGLDLFAKHFMNLWD